MDAIKDLFARGVWGITLGDISLAALTLVAGFVAGRIARKVLKQMVQHVPEHSVRHATVESLTGPTMWVLRGIGIWGALSLIPLPKIDAFDIHGFLNTVYQSLTVGLATWVGVRAVSNFTALWAHRATGTESTYDDQLVPIVRKTAKVVVVVLGTVMVLQNMNYNVGSLLAGLGIGGAALAFASKDTVANFFGSLVIFIDRPFQIGDWVQIGKVEGTVEQVDVRVTRIRTFANSLIIVPNSQMTITAIENWSRMRKRRIKLRLGITYSATPDQIREGVAAVRKIIEADDRFLTDFYLVNFNDFGESGLEIFCYFFTETTNWAEYMGIREDFLLSVMDAFKEIGISFAFPTRTVHIEGDTPAGAPPAMTRGRPL